MSNTAQVLRAEFEALRSELIARHDELGMRASGKWADSLAVSVTPTGASIMQAGYSDQLEHGRRLGKQPPSEAIEQWLKDKGIAARIEKDISISSLAFLIARKIGREGWNRQQHGGTGLISSVVTPERIQQILDKIGHSHLQDFTKDIVTYLKTAAA